MADLKKGMKFEEFAETMAREKLTIQEVLTKSEGSALFLTTLDMKMLDAYRAVPSQWQAVADEIITDSDIRLPELIGLQASLKPELSEIRFADADITGTTYSLNSFGLRVGISQEMIEDNKIGLIGWITEKAGQRMKELEDIEVFKCLDNRNSTGAAVNAVVNAFLGQENRGVNYPTGGFTNGVSGTALNWEDAIATAMATLPAQTRTVNGRVYNYPSYPNIIICNPSREWGIRKVLQPAMTVTVTGAGNVNNAGAGTNIFQNVLSIVSTPRVAPRLVYIAEAKKGVVLFRHPLYRNPRIERTANFPYDAQEIKAVSRFMPAVIDERSIFAVLT